MCQIVTTLTVRSEHRSVAQCEHGTVFIHWQFSTWTLQISDFNALTSFLNLEHPAADFTDGPYTLRRNSSGQVSAVQLWLGVAALAFTPPDFEEFCAMLRQAAPKVNEFLIGSRVEGSRLAFN